MVARAEGPYVFDVEGTRYIDLVQSYGAIILGHAHPAITAAVQAVADALRPLYALFPESLRPLPGQLGSGPGRGPARGAPGGSASPACLPAGMRRG